MLEDVASFNFNVHEQLLKAIRVLSDLIDLKCRIMFN